MRMKPAIRDNCAWISDAIDGYNGSYRRCMTVSAMGHEVSDNWLTNSYLDHDELHNMTE